ncbi:MAG TPA: diaminopimelate decarboxylase [Firmicutes bacterium]|nr:diaminopimelate decarboxylase [Bacillota bacterium]
MSKSITEVFWGDLNPEQLLDKYGSPLYIYNEQIIRERCRELKNLLPYPWFTVNYSAKANSNLELLRLIKEEGINADAVSSGEIYLLLKAGFEPDQILFVANNISAEEMKFAIDQGVTISLDSLSQLVTFGRINPGGRVAVRFNPGVGAGHHEKVMTGGRNTKFGVDAELVEEVKKIAAEYALWIVGVNQHIGSLFLDGEPYLTGVRALLEIAAEFPELEFIDFGGGFGIPYHWSAGEERLDLPALAAELEQILPAWRRNYGREVKMKIEPGRYLVAESGVLLGRVLNVKQNHTKKFIGTDLGFNVLMRPVLYDSYHEITAFRQGIPLSGGPQEIVTVVGNICESGDILGRDRELPPLKVGDVLAVWDAGAYGYAMASNYNLRLRPAEVLITADGREKLIRKRDTFEDLLRNFLTL